MNVPAKPKHRPYLFSGAVFEIGLRPMDMAEWLDVEPDHAAFMAAKRARLKGRPPLFYRSLERSRAAQAELLNLAAAHLLANHGTVYSGDGALLRDHLDGSRHKLTDGTQEPLEILGNLVEEDFVLFAAEEGGDIVTAASNAYTSSGRIVSCVGRNMRFAHEPVPGLNEQLGARIDRVIGHVQPGKPVVRFNWFVTPFASRLFPERSHAANIEAAAQVAEVLGQDFRKAGELLWLRVERQTFVRLPETAALAFGIHTYSHPLSTVADDGEGLAAMDRLLAAYSEDRLRYGGMLATRDPIRRWIAGVSG